MDKYLVKKNDEYIFYSEPLQTYFDDTKQVHQKTPREKVRELLQQKRSVSLWCARETYVVLSHVEEIVNLDFLAMLYVRNVPLKEDYLLIALSNGDLLLHDFNGDCYIFPKQVIKNVTFDKKFKNDFEISFNDETMPSIIFRKNDDTNKCLLSNKHMNKYFADLYNQES